MMPGYNQINKMKVVMALLCLLLGAFCSKGNQPVYTQVTCMYDIKRGDISSTVYKRSYDDYLRYFGQLLQTDTNLIIYGGADLQEFVWKRRKPHNTVFVLREIESFREMWFYPMVQRLRKEVPQRPGFILHDHPAFRLEYYNMLMFGKLFLLTAALQHDKFNSDFFIWTDGGLTHVFPEQQKMLYPEDHLIKWFTFIQPQWLFLSTTYGLRYQGFANGSYPYVGLDVEEVILGGFFGGYVEIIQDAKCTYQNFLRIMLQNGDMNSDETTYSMLPYRYPYLFPISTSAWFNHLYKKLHVFMNSNRKQEHHRRFKPDFDNFGNLIAIGQKVITQTMIDDENRCLSQRFQGLVQIQKRCYRQTNQLSELLGKNLYLIKQIFRRETICLLLLVFFYVFTKIKAKMYAGLENKPIPTTARAS